AISERTISERKTKSEPRVPYERRNKSLSGSALVRRSSARSAPFPTTFSKRSLASSVQSDTVSRASSYERRKSFRSCRPVFGASSRPTAAPTPSPISRNVTAVPAELPELSYFPMRIRTSSNPYSRPFSSPQRCGDNLDLQSPVQSIDGEGNAPRLGFSVSPCLRGEQGSQEAARHCLGFPQPASPV